VAAGAAAALALICSSLVRFPVAGEGAMAQAGTPEQSSPPRARKVKRQVRYVKLKPGQKAPRGARVIREKAPAPRVVVRLVAPAAQGVTRSTPRRVVTRTRQSGG
jgi:hypothetical protein